MTRENTTVTEDLARREATPSSIAPPQTRSTDPWSEPAEEESAKPLSRFEMIEILWPEKAAILGSIRIGPVPPPPVLHADLWGEKEADGTT